MTYHSGEAWGSALARLFNPDPMDGGAITSPEDTAAHARICAGVAVLYIPGVSRVVIDDRDMDFDGVVQSVYRVRRTTVHSGALVIITVRDFARLETPAGVKASCIWRISLEDHPPESGLPPAKRPLPPVVDVRVEAMLDQPGPEGRAVSVTARSEAILPPESSSDDD